jgi:ABC-type polysaccharide/polyol phosphate transport system ATPase subunit
MSALPSTAIAMPNVDPRFERAARPIQPSPHRQVRSALMITVSGLTRQYGKRLAVDDMTFDVAGGRVTGFVGPNGAGKSTPCG